MALLVKKQSSDVNEDHNLRLNCVLQFAKSTRARIPIGGKESDLGPALQGTTVHRLLGPPGRMEVIYI